jgi:hypothetical protein
MTSKREERGPAAAGEGADREPTLQGVFDSDGVDLTVIRWMLSMTPTERLRAVQDLIDAASALRGGHGP